MRFIRRSDIKPTSVYNGIRDDFRKHIIALKKHRRVAIGDRVSLVFENRHTLISQIQEILRAEGITDEEEIVSEIALYNELMPTDDSLSATLFLEVPEGTDSRTELDRLIGLDEHVILHIGEHSIRAAFEEGRSTSERISAVQYTRYPLSPEAKQALLTPGTPLRMEIDHPGYQHITDLPEEARASLAKDFEDSEKAS